MCEGWESIDLTYLDGVFEADELDALSSRLLEVLRNAGLAPDGAVPGGRRSQEEFDDACNVLLDPIALELRELEPRRYGLVYRNEAFDVFEEVHVSPDSDASLDAVLLASWLLRSGRVNSLSLGPMGMITQPLSTVIKATLPLCARTLNSLKLEGFRFSQADVENVLSGAASMEALESLHLMYLPLTAAATLSIGRLLLANANCLKVLAIGPDKLEGGREIAACVCQCLNLTSLHLWCVPFDDEGLTLFHDFLLMTESLQTLSVDNCDHREARSILHALRSNRRLKKAELTVKHEDPESLGEEVADVLSDNTTLESLCLRNLSLPSPENILCVFATLKENKTLKHFGVGLVDLISGDRDEGETGSPVVAVVRENSTLESLHIEWCMMTNKTMKSLAQALVANPVLKILRIGANDLEEDEESSSFREAVRDSCDRIETIWNNAGLEELALTLPHSRVERLDLSLQVERESAPLLQVLKGLAMNRTITRLHIHGIDCFGDVEIAALADYLRSTAILKWISMSFEIEYACYGIPLIDALAENTSVCRVDFGTFDMGIEACEHFGAMLVKNRTLQWVTQNERYAGSKELEPIAQGMESNYTLLGLTLGSKPPCPAWSRIGRALAANGRRLNRAVDFVLETVVEGDTSRCEEAFRLLSDLESLRKQLAKVTSSSEARVEELIEAARKRLPQAMSV
ncbi:hypothetical protein V5799_017773 [Amblyomma americanum]|uniref:Ran gtpase-activating protein n=1 Tax=Amblyomma americanum TaxID=6943 RepID=A0AAQ4F180_AMBAM